MYLLIGYPTDRCCERVEDRLRQQGHEVYRALDPLADPVAFRWAFDSAASESHLRLPGGAEITGSDLRGVLVRAPGGPVSTDGWQAQDLPYVQAEAQAALIAWLWSLSCPVVNRPSADLWFRPQRPYPEWRMLFLACGLPALAVQVTNDMGAAHRFAEAWDDAVVYAPLTSATRYPVATGSQWDELAKVTAHIPVCLLEPWEGVVTPVTVIGDRIVWDERAAVGPADRAALAPGLARLAARLGLAALQVEVAVGPRGLRCVSLEVWPLLERHDEPAQARIVDALVSLLT